VAFLAEPATAGLIGGLALIPIGLYLVTVPRGRVVVPKADPPALRAGILMALTAALLWAVSSVIIRPALDQVDVLTATAFRMVTGAMTLWLIAGWRARRAAAPAQFPRFRIALLGGTISSCSMFLYTLAIQQAGAARTSTLGATAPLYAVPLSALLLGEHVTPRMAFGTLLAVAGVILVVSL
jgi:drug/metabolite transporter (DMT)-like permease